MGKIRKHTALKQRVRFKRRKRIRSSVSGTAQRPRLSVFRSNQHLYVQLIDDLAARTLVSVSTQSHSKEIPMGATKEGAKLLGQMVAKQALSKDVKKIVFDRGGYLYHGRIQALADAAREAGLEF